MLRSVIVAAAGKATRIPILRKSRNQPKPFAQEEVLSAYAGKRGRNIARMDKINKQAADTSLTILYPNAYRPVPGKMIRKNIPSRAKLPNMRRIDPVTVESASNSCLSCGQES